MKKVSIIIPVFNCERYISACLDSIIHQTYDNIEIIIINDGSTDRSGIICERYAKKCEFVHVYYQENSGAGIARNRGFAYSTGEYIMYVDADDYISLHCIADVVEQLEKYCADIVEVGMVITLATRNLFSNCDQTITVLKGRGQIEQNSKYLRNVVCGRLYRRNMIEGVDFTDRRIGEDCEFSVKILKNCNIFIRYNYGLYVYRAYQESVTREKIYNKTFSSLKNQLKEIIKKPDNEENKKNEFQDWFKKYKRTFNVIRHRNEEALYYRNFIDIKNFIYNHKEELLKNMPRELCLELEVIEKDLDSAIQIGDIGKIKRMIRKLRHLVSAVFGWWKVKINYMYKL